MCFPYSRSGTIKLGYNNILCNINSKTIEYQNWGTCDNIIIQPNTNAISLRK